MSKCTYNHLKEIISHTQLCTYISNNCPGDYINFYYLHFCTFNSHFYITIPIFIIILIILFYLLSDTSNNFLGYSLTKIVDKLKINQNIAGVTILAFGNGASDVISSLVASKEIEGLEFAIGSLIGGGMFITSFVFGLVVYYGNNLSVNSEFYNRDIILYIISVVYLVLICLYEKINLGVSFGFILIYVVYVGLAIYQDRKNRISFSVLEQNMNFNKIDDIKNTDIDLENNAIELISGSSYSSIGENTNPKIILSTEENNDNINNKLEGISSYKNDERKEVSIENEISTNNTSISNKSKIENSILAAQIADDVKDEIKEQILHQVKEELIYNNNTVSKILDDNIQQLKIKVKKYYYNYKESNWDDDAFYWKLYYILIDFPFTLIRELTIPIYENKKWNKIKFCLNPLCQFIFFSYTLQLYNYFLENVFSLILILTILILITIFLISKINEETPKKYEYLIIFLTFAMSLFWLWFIANILISILQTIGLIFNIPDSFLAMTILTFGNCVTDLFLNISLVKGGYGEMALAGSIGGPLFNLLIGLGISLLKINISFGTIEIHMFNKENFICILAIFSLIINLVRLFIQSKNNLYVLRNNIAYGGFIVYFLFFVAVIIFTFFNNLFY